MADELRAKLPRIADQNIRATLETIARRLNALEVKHTELSGVALKTGSPVVAYGQRIQDLGEPVASDDAVTLRYLQRYVQSVVQVERGVPDRPTIDAGTAPGVPLAVGTLDASPSTLPFGGGTVTLTWTSQGAVSAEIIGFAGGSTLGAVPLNGNQNVSITVTASWALVLRNSAGVATVFTDAVTVNGAAPAPAPTGSFQASVLTATPGQTVLLSWSSVNATSATILPSPGVVTPVAGGTIGVVVSITTTFELRLTGDGGTAIYRLTVTVTQPTTPPPTTPPPTTPTGMVAQVSGWGFANNGRRFMWNGFTAFPLFHDSLDPTRVARAANVVDTFQAQKATVPRVFLTIAGNPFGDAGIRLYPTERNPETYFGVLRQMIRYLNDRGMMPELVIFGAFVEIWGQDQNALNAMVAFTQDVARQLINERGAFIQIANEWNQIGFTHPSQLVTLANAYLAIDPNRPVTLSASNGPGDLLGDTHIEPAKYLTVHSDRVQTPRPYEWVIRHFFNPWMMQTSRPAVSDEPINAGPAAFGAYDADPQNWYAFGWFSRLLQWSTTFHYEGGLFGNVPVGETYDCLVAWSRALNDLFAYNPDVGGSLFAVTSGGIVAGAPSHSPWPTSGTNFAVIGRNVNGTAIALVLGPGTLPALNPGWGTPVGPFVPSDGYSAIKVYMVPPAPLG